MATEITTVIFDFDGVVLESSDVKTDAFIELFAEHGPEVQRKVREHHLANLGISRFKKFAWIYEHVLRAPLDEARSAALGRRFSELALEKVLAAPFVLGAHEALAMLATRIPLFVASGTPHDELLHICERRGLTALFRGIYGAPREKPEIIASILTAVGARPDQALFVGDGMSDHKAAVATGVHFLARDTPDLHDEWCRAGVRMRPDLVDLPALVEAW